MRARTLALLTLGFLALLAAVNWLVLSRTGISRTMVRDELSALLAVPFELGETTLDPMAGRLGISGFEVRSPAGGISLKAPFVSVGFSRSAASLGRVTSVQAKGPELALDLTRDLDLESLLRERGPEPGGPLPFVSMTEATLSLDLPVPGLPPVILRSFDLSLEPDAAEPHRWVVSCAFRNPLGGRVRVPGFTSPASGTLELRAVAEPFDVRPDRERLGEQVASALEDLHLEARMAVSATIRLPRREGEPAARIRTELERLRLVPPYFRHELANLSGIVEVEPSGERTLVRLDVENGSGLPVKARGTVLLGGEHPVLDLEIRGKDIPVTQQVRNAMTKEIEEAQHVWDAFEANGGQADLLLQIRTTESARKAKVWMDLSFAGTSARFIGLLDEGGARDKGFPYPLDRCSGTLHLRPGGQVVIDGIRGTTQGLEILVYGEIATEEMGRALDLTVEATRMTLDERLREAMAAALDDGAEIFDEYAPEGEADVNCRLHRAAGEKTLRATLAIHPRSASAKFAGFPHRIDRLQGVIAIGPEVSAFDLTGERNGCTIAGKGRFLRTGACELLLRGKGLALSAELRTALCVVYPPAGEIWDSASPGGRCDFTFAGWRSSSDAELSYDLRCELADVTLLSTQFPLPVRGVRGPIYLHGRGGSATLEVPAVFGSAAGGTLVVHGSVRPDPGREAQIDVTIAGRGIELSSELADALDRKEILARALWDTIKPSGRIDVTHRILRDRAHPETDDTIRVRLRDVVSDAEILPGRATHVNGEISAHGGTVEVTDLHARINEAVVQCERATLRKEGGATLIELELSTEGFRIDERLARIFTGSVRQAWLDRRVNGFLDATGLRIGIKIPDDDRGVSATFSGSFNTRQGQMVVGLPVTGLSGPWQIKTGNVTPTSASIEGSFDGLTLTIEGHQLHQLKGEFASSSDWLELRTLSTVLHGGTISNSGNESAMRFSFNAPQDLNLRLQMRDMRLEEFLSASGQQKPEYRGSLAGSVALDIPNLDLLATRGHIGLSVSEGYLGSAPVFRAIYSLVRAERRPSFDAGILELDVGAQGVNISRLVLTSPLLKIEGHGTLGFDTYLDLEIKFPNLFPEARAYFIIPFIYEWLANRLVAFRVWGYLRNLRSAAFVPLTEGTPPREPIAPVTPERRERARARF